MGYHEDIIKAAQARGAAAECWMLDRRMVEYVIRDGEVERFGRTGVQRANVSARTGSREGYVSCSAGTDPGQVVDAAIMTANTLPTAAEALTRTPRTEDVTGPTADGTYLAPEGLQQLVKTSQPTQDGSIELRLHGEKRTVILADSDGLDLTYRTYLAMATARVTVRGAVVAQLTHDYFAPSLQNLTHLLCSGELAAQSEHARLLSRASQPLAHPVRRVLVHGRVASRVLSLLCPAVGADALIQRRSMLANPIGTAVASPKLSVADDMADPRCPLRVPWDDEGTPIARVPLIEAGLLKRFLADHRYAQKAGTGRTGSGWRGEGGEMPTIRPGCLLFDVDSPAVSAQDALARDGEPVLHIVQANGMHMANDVTGEFSFAASGLLHHVDGRVTTVDGLTVAGNVYDLLRTVEEHDGNEVLWRHELSFVSSPGIWASCLAVGR